MAGAHLHVVLIPGVNHDLAAEVVHVEPGAALHGNRRISTTLATAFTAAFALLQGE